MRSYWAAIVGSLVAVTGCVQDRNGDGIADNVRDPTSVVLNAPSTPTGTVSGQVLSTRLQPLDGVTVTLNAGGLKNGNEDASTFTGLSTVTDASGTFSFTGVPAGGDILVTLSKQGYSTVRVTTSIANTAGDAPLSNANANVGPYTMTQTNATLKFLVVDRNGRPAKGAKAVLEAAPAATLVSGNSAYGTGRGVVIADATADDAGFLTFSSIPGPDELARLSTSGSEYTVTVAALDSNNDGIPDSAGVVNTYSARTMLTDSTTPVIRLPDARGNLGNFQVLASNVGSFPTSNGGGSALGAYTENVLRPTDPIYMVFNHYVLDSSVTIRISDETGKQFFTSTKTLTGGSVLTITPAGLTANKEYNIAVHAVSLDTGAVYDGLAYFFVADLAAPAPAVDVTSVQFHDTGLSPDGFLNPGEIVEVNFNQPMGIPGNPTLNIVYFDRDLNGSTSTGDSFGEKGHTGTGFTLLRTEYAGGPDGTATNQTLNVKQSGYTTRYAFRYNGGVNVPASTTVQLAFNRLSDSSGNIQSLWGQPLQGIIEKPLAVTTQPFAPSFVNP